MGSFESTFASVLMVFCGSHLLLAFQFVCGPGGRGGLANKLEGMWKVSLCLVAPSRGRLRDRVQVVVFAGGPLFKTFVPFGTLLAREERGGGGGRRQKRTFSCIRLLQEAFAGHSINGNFKTFVKSAVEKRLPAAFSALFSEAKKNNLRYISAEIEGNVKPLFRQIAS